MADQSSGGSGSAAAVAPIISGSGSGMRKYRKGNWTLQETMILIEAKKMDDERRLKRSSTTTTTLTDQQQQQLTSPSSTPGSSSSSQQQQQEMAMLLMMRSSTTNKAAGELKWKWVEDYCWRRGCFRSQNQCNDKWDNLMRDYKKVRDYQRNLILNNQQRRQGQEQQQSYWNMEKSERKERGLPSSMLPTIYDALVQVVEKKSSASPSPASALLLPPTTSSTDVQPIAASTSGALSLLLLQQQQMTSAALALPPPQSQSQSRSQPPSFSSQPLIIPSTMLFQTAPKTIPGDSLLDSDTSSESPAKRRRKEKRSAEPTAAGGVGAGGGGTPSASTGDSASEMCKISEAMQESERRRDERHREMVMLKQRRLQIEESSMEVNRQGMSGLVDAINTLANSILALTAAAFNNTNIGQTPPKPPS